MHDFLEVWLFVALFVGGISLLVAMIVALSIGPDYDDVDAVFIKVYSGIALLMVVWPVAIPVLVVIFLYKGMKGIISVWKKDKR